MSGVTQGKAVGLVGTSAQSRADAAVVTECGCRALRLESPTAGSGAALVLLDADAVWSRSGQLTGLGLGRATSPVVLLASPTTPTELVEAAAQAGIDDVIVRPLLPAQLQERLGATSTAPAPAPRVAGRRGPRTVVLAGEPFEGRGRLALALEYDGYQVLDLPAVQPRLQQEALVRQAGRIDLLLFARDEARPAALDWLLDLSRGNAERPVPRLVLGERSVTRSDDGVRQLARSTPCAQLLAEVCSLVDRPGGSLQAAGRVPFVCPVEFREAGGTVPGGWRSGFSVNVSPGGLFVRTLIPMRAGSAVEVKIHLSTTREELAVTGVVAWSNPYPRKAPLSYPVGMGVQFLGAISRKLRGLIAACGAQPTDEGSQPLDEQP